MHIFGACTGAPVSELAGGAPDLAIPTDGFIWHKMISPGTPESPGSPAAGYKNIKIITGKDI